MRPVEVLTPIKEPAVSVTEFELFEVSEGGTLRMAGYTEAKTRADFYESIADQWSGSPEDLSDAMDEIQPLAWAVQSLYTEFRDALTTDLDTAQNEKRVAALKAKLKTLPEEPEEGTQNL